MADEPHIDFCTLGMFIIGTLAVSMDPADAHSLQTKLSFPHQNRLSKA